MDPEPLVLDAWIERRLPVSIARLLAAVSATGLAHQGPRVGQVMVPAPGSVLAAPGAGPGEQNYFFHWLRDSAVVVRALLVLHRLGSLPAAARARFAEAIAFDGALQRLDGGRAVASEAWPPVLLPHLQGYLRPRGELAAVRRSTLPGEVRFHPDGSLDLMRWSRPQDDGPALRALRTLDMLAGDALPGERDRRRAGRLLAVDLGYCLARLGEPSYDPWEEENGQHFYTRLVQHAALARAASRAAAGGHPRLAKRYAAGADALALALHGFWSPADGFYRSRLPGPGLSPAKSLDSVVLLAVLHAGLSDGPFSVLDPRVEATVDRLQGFFAGYLPVNAGRAPADGVLLGRYAGDTYYDGGAFLPCCFGLAEFHFRRAAAGGGRRDLARGDAVLAFARRFLPADGALPEQLDRVTGAPRSAADLSWSHAAFVTAAAARAAGPHR